MGMDEGTRGGADSSGEFEGHTAVVTGAASGIGRATALLLATRGATVVCADLDEAGARATAERCSEGGSKALGLGLDQRSTDSVNAVVRETLERTGRIDVLANVAGIFPFATVADTDDDLWSSVIGTNLDGTFRCCRAVAPIMLEAGRGSIVNIASGAAVRGFPGLGAYAASKAGIIGFSRVLALEVAPKVRVNVVAPGPTASRETPLAGAPAVDPDLMEAAARMDIPMGRQAKPEEIAEGIAWLCSERAGFVTGQVIHVNGGRFMP